MDDSYSVEFEDEPDPMGSRVPGGSHGAGRGRGCRCRRREGVRGLLYVKMEKSSPEHQGAMWGGGCQLHVVWVDETLRNGWYRPSAHGGGGACSETPRMPACHGLDL